MTEKKPAPVRRPSPVFTTYLICAESNIVTERYVVRRQHIYPDGSMSMGKETACDSLAQAREEVPTGKARLGKQPSDADFVVETWN